MCDLPEIYIFLLKNFQQAPNKCQILYPEADKPYQVRDDVSLGELGE